MAKLLVAVVSVLLVSSANSQSCSGERTSPQGTYTVMWYGDLDTGIIQFNASVDNMGWIGVGISNDRFMPDSDVIVGAINADDPTEYFIEDRYAFARQRPRFDAESNIFDTSVTIEDDQVVISFTRYLDTQDETDDISLIGCHYLLWAWAGPVTDYGDEDTPATFGQHGLAGSFDEQICCEPEPEPEPDLCSNCSSIDEYTYCWRRSGDYVDFNVTAQTTSWVGFGISLNRMMPNSDIVVGAANPEDATEYFVQDRFATARALPPEDASNDLTSVSATHENGYTTISFTRRIDTGDDDDIDLTECRYILWAVGGMVSYDPAGPTSQHSNQGSFNELLCLPSIETCPGPTVAPTDGAAMMSVSIATLLMALAAIIAVLY